MKIYHYKFTFILSFFFFFGNVSLHAQSTYSGELGYGVSPAGQPYNYSQFPAFLQEVANTCSGGVVYGNGAWRDSVPTCGHIPTLQKTVCQLQPSPYAYTDMITMGWAHYPTLYLKSPTDTTNNWTNTSAKNLFLEALIRAADSLHPTYLFIGNEVNFYWEQDSLDYANWVSFYNMAYDSVKAYSPTTKVGTIFNFEQLSGNGSNVNWNKPYWNALTTMDSSRIDIYGLTLYPFLGIDSAHLVPNNYLDPFFAHIGNKPVAITETGWPGDSLIGSWISSPQQQVDYVNKLFTMISGKNVVDVNWLYLNYLLDTSTTASNLIFKSVALRDSMGNDRPALSTWLSECPASGIAQITSVQNEVHVFPNPSNGNFQVNFDIPENKAHIVLYNSEGQLVFQRMLNNSNNLLLHLRLSPGLYFYLISGEKGMLKSGKLVIAN